MAGPTCFWSFLTLQHLEFVYVSPTKGSQPVFPDKYDITIKDLLMHRSLFDFIHPDEWAIAKQDLSTFLRRKTLAGAVTR
jgi:CubicO group peptidase (beta-lactamase class C family)